VKKRNNTQSKFEQQIKIQLVTITKTYQ